MDIRPNASRARVAIIMLYLVIVTEVGMFFTSWLLVNLYSRMSHGEEISENQRLIMEGISGFMGLLYVGLFIASGVMFIKWFRRAYYNMHQRVKTLLFEEGWAAGAWFVPVINIFRPYRIMEELYDNAAKLVPNSENTKKGMLGWWWTLWIAGNLISYISFRISAGSELPEDLLTSAQMDMISNVVAIPSALLAITVVRQYAKAEEEMNHPLSMEEKPSVVPE